MTKTGNSTSSLVTMITSVVPIETRNMTSTPNITVTTNLPSSTDTTEPTSSKDDTDLGLIIGCAVGGAVVLVVVVVLVVCLCRRKYRRKPKPPILPDPFQLHRRHTVEASNLTSSGTDQPGSDGVNNPGYSDDDNEERERRGSASSNVYVNTKKSPHSPIFTCPQNSDVQQTSDNFTHSPTGTDRKPLKDNPTRPAVPKTTKPLIPKANSETHIHVKVPPQLKWRNQKPIIHSPEPTEDELYMQMKPSSKPRPMSITLPTPEEPNFNLSPENAQTNVNTDLPKLPAPCPGQATRGYVNLKPKTGEDGPPEDYINVTKWSKMTEQPNDPSLELSENINDTGEGFAPQSSVKYANLAKNEHRSLSLPAKTQEFNRNHQDYVTNSEATIDTEEQPQQPLNNVNVQDYVNAPPIKSIFDENNASVPEPGVPGQYSNKPKSSEPPVTLPKPKVKHSNTAPPGPRKKVIKLRDQTQPNHIDKDNLNFQNGSDLGRDPAELADIADEDDDIYENTNQSVQNKSESLISSGISHNSLPGSNHRPNGVKTSKPASILPPNSTIPKTQNKPNISIPVDIADQRSRLKKTKNKFMED